MSEEDQLVSQSASQLADYLGRKKMQEQELQANALKQQQLLQQEQDKAKAVEAAKAAELARQKQEFEQYAAKPEFKDRPIHIGQYSVGGKPVDPAADLKIWMQKEQYQKQLAEGKKQPLPAGEAEKLGGANFASKAVQDAMSQHSTLGAGTGPVVGRLKSFLGGQSEGMRKFKAAQEQNAQIIGTYLEGGKLTDKDFPKYQNMLPRPADTAEVAKAKAEHLAKLIEMKQTGHYDALKQSGYKVEDIATLAKEKPMQSQQQMPVSNQASSEDAEALSWAKANINDPRAQKILQMHGVK